MSIGASRNALWLGVPRRVRAPPFFSAAVSRPTRTEHPRLAMPCTHTKQRRVPFFNSHLLFHTSSPLPCTESDPEREASEKLLVIHSLMGSIPRVDFVFLPKTNCTLRLLHHGLPRCWPIPRYKHSLIARIHPHPFSTSILQELRIPAPERLSHPPLSHPRKGIDVCRLMFPSQSPLVALPIGGDVFLVFQSELLYGGLDVRVPPILAHLLCAASEVCLFDIQHLACFIGTTRVGIGEGRRWGLDSTTRSLDTSPSPPLSIVWNL